MAATPCILPDDFVESVRGLIQQRVEAAVVPLLGTEAADRLAPGKMLRTRLAARLACRGSDVDFAYVERACAAVELIHTASLCHDDVIDGAAMRRGRPALWRETGASRAILLGDLLLCEAFGLVAQNGAGCVRVFAERVGEVAAAEAEQELALPGRSTDEGTCLRLARGKTGPLFAFSAWAAGGPDQKCRAACCRAGYRIGAAYQLADDLLDTVGGERAAGKTLGTDARLGKVTLPGLGPDGPGRTRAQVHRLCEAARDALHSWPRARAALTDFLALDLQPVLDRYVPGLVVAAGEPSARHQGGRA